MLISAVLYTDTTNQVKVFNKFLNCTLLVNLSATCSAGHKHSAIHNIRENNDTYKSHLNSAAWLSSAADGQETGMQIGIMEVLC